MRKLICLLACALALFAPTHSHAQPFPSKPITLVVPYSPGGSTDQVARRLLDSMSRELGQTVLVENKAGAAGTVGVDTVATAAPDGYRLLILTGGAIHAHSSRNVDIRKLTFIASLARVPQVLVVSADSPFKNIRELQNSGKPINIATTGEGYLSTYNAMTLQAEVRGGATLIPYEGAAPALQDLLRRQVAAGFFTLPAVIEQVKGGQAPDHRSYRRRAASRPR